MRVRDATDADLPAIAEIMTEADPDHPWSPETLAHELATMRAHPLGLQVGLWVAEAEDGDLLGTATTLQFAGMYHPGRHHAELQVRPRAERRGVGSALAATVEAHLRAAGAREVLAGASEARPHALRFLQQRGFVEVMRFWDNVLTLDGFDFAAWEAHERLPGGLRARSLPGLEAELGQDAARRAYYAGFAEARLDVPRTGEATEMTFEEFLKRLEGPELFPEGLWLAVTDDHEVVALSELWRSDAGPHRLNTGLTGTRRAWRRRGLALALKLAALRVAVGAGAREIWTGNATTNAPMLAINDRLGFRPRPAFVEMKWGGIEE